ncbi:hypothetical protein L195_g005183 [Trifolium pratense]|uniref:Uncharacterized protein n=1 Tax=Trifolium pratense TaxID=57577 RepID=A0A2K3P090_TRIPR|nr:hypothetical protein L195_g005183 [Trifolium pratense]
MNSLDEQNTTFMTNTSNFYYKIMWYRFNNVDATYQCLVDRVFSEHIGRNLEMCIDNMVVKTKTEDRHDQDLEENLGSVRKYNMILNPSPTKYSFRVQI